MLRRGAYRSTDTKKDYKAVKKNFIFLLKFLKNYCKKGTDVVKYA